MRFKTFSRGFTLVETLVGAFILVVVSLGIYQGFFAATQIVNLGKIKTEAGLLANEQFELIRNLPYQSVGIAGGLPAGVLPRSQSFARSGVTFLATTTIRNLDDPFDGTIGGAPNDTAPADYKIVSLTIGCAGCVLRNELIFTTTVAPKSVESASGNGALFISVIDADGQPVPQVGVHVENNQLTPVINLDELTNNNGELQLVDVPPDELAYEIRVSKAGYSSAQTYSPNDPENPNPLQLHATVVAGQVTAITFIIDQLTGLTVETKNSTCLPIGNQPFTLTGSKLLGTDPDLLVYDEDLTTNGAGQLVLPALDWDTYSLTFTGVNYQLVGSSPLLPVALAPGAEQTLSLTLASANPRGLLVIVKDAASGLPLADALVDLSQGGDSQSQLTGRGSFRQTDWSGGAGQDNFTDPTKYASDNGEVDVVGPPGDLALRSVSGDYSPLGLLTSSVFDSGATTTTYHQLTWLPENQATTTGAEGLKFQLASADENTATTTWNFIGPDGSPASFYTAPTSQIGLGHQSDRYLRYRVQLSTVDEAATPRLSDVAVTYGQECVPPGQTFFGGLAGGNYALTVSLAGYQTYQTSPLVVNNDWQKLEVPLQPL